MSRARKRTRDRMRRRGRCATRLVVAGALGLATAAHADVVRDGSIGALGPGQVGTAIGPGGGTDYLITEADGARSGNNLFHSFSSFDLTSTERAIYQGSPTIENLVTRVTGGPSSIDGVIRSEIPGANLYFLNPAGVLFGENARVDLTGAFYVSTADRLLFDGGDVFETSLGAGGTLSVADVTGFGFLDAPAPITITGSRIEIESGGDIGLIGGDLTLTGGRTDGAAFLSSQGGRVDLASLASSGEVYVDPGDALRLENVAERGDVLIEDEFTINSSGINRDPFSILGFFNPPLPNPGSGSVNVYANDLTMLDSDITTVTGTMDDAGDVVLDLDGDLEIRSVSTLRQSGINAGSGLNIPKGPGDVSRPFPQINTLFFNALGLIVTSEICVAGPCSLTYDPTGDAGDVLVRARNVRLEDGGRITSFAEGRGAAGTVTLRVSDSIHMSGAQPSGERSGLAATTEGVGAPGRIVIDSPTATLVMGDSAAIVIENGVDSGPTGPGGVVGEIDIDVASLAMSGDARIDSSTRGQGDGGTIDVVAPDFVLLSGRTSGTEFTGITTLSQPGSTGAAGNVRVETGLLQLANGAEISARPVANGGAGDAGSLVFDVANDVILEDSTISTESASAGGGNIDLFASRLVRLRRSSVTSSVTTGAAPGGNVTITSDPGSVVALSDSRIVAQADAGAGGNILIETSLLLEGATSVISASSNTGIDGTVIRRAPDGQLIDLSQEFNVPSMDASALMDEPCASRRPGGANSLVVSASDGLPVDVSAVLPGFLPPEVYARLGVASEDVADARGTSSVETTLAARTDAAAHARSCLN